MAQADQHAARVKMNRPMVTFVVIYCLCVWSTVCFSCIEADPLPHQRQMNTNGTSGNSIGIITSTTAIIGAIVGIIVAIGVIIGIAAKSFQRPKITQSPVLLDREPNSNGIVAAGQTAKLKCEANGKPAPKFQWLKNDRNVAVSADVTVTTVNGKSTLTINNIQKSDAGQYKCKASSLFSCWDDISDNATITVASPPTITQDPGAAKVKSGSEASFTCVASRDLIPAMSITSSYLPPMEFSWQKDGSSIFTSSSVTVHKSGNSSTLTLKHVSTTDAGSYTCTATYVGGSVTSNAATLQVTDPPTVTQDPGGAKVKSGSEASFTCVALSDLPMEFGWQKDSSSIIFSSSITVNTSENMSTLILNPVSTTDAGSYTCTVSNDAGTVTSNAATLQVTDPPTITQDPKETTVRSGSEASFTCVASSDLPMEFSWQKDGSSMIFSSSITVNTSGNMSTLILKPVSTADAGSYTCTASNDAGSVTSNAATLQVTGGIIEKLKQSIPDNTPYTWNPLPECKSPVELAMIRVNRKEEQQPNTERLKNRTMGNFEKIMNSPGVVEVKVYEIFDSGLFKDDGLIILLEGGPGMGKTTLGYSYCKKWKDGGLHEFDMAAFVSLRETDKEKEAAFDNLLFLACGNDEVMKEELKHSVKSGTSLLLVLDGWDEAPDIVRNSPGTFIHMLQRSIPSQSKSKILITSRPDSSVDLDVNRVEIVGFTKESIKEYFKEALCSSLNDEREIEDGCKELENHLEAHPPIQSCCTIPLNAAIVARLFLASDKKPRTLPHTRHELFSSIVAHLINKEQEKPCTYAHKQLAVSHISCLEDLPDSLKSPLCRLAFDHLKEIVIPHEMVASTQLVECEGANPIDASFNSVTPILSSCLHAVLQTVEKRDLKSACIIHYYHFIHLSIQELLAAYHISQLEEDKQVKMFKDLLYEPRFSSVLQFYAAFTRFTNQGVRDIVTEIDLANKKHILLTIMRCCFEANCQDQLLYQKINQKLNGGLRIGGVALTPFDCMSVGYFLAFALRAGELLSVNLEGCRIDDHSLGLLLEEVSRHGEACQAGVLQGVTDLYITRSNIGDDGITHLATVLQANTTMKTLCIAFNSGITDNGAKSLGRALSVNSSLEWLDIRGTSIIGDEGVAHIANALHTNTTMKVLSVSKCGISCKGAEALARALSVNSSLEELSISFDILGDNGKAHIATALQANNALKSLSFDDDIDIVTDKAALSIGAALTTNTSMKVMRLEWTSTHPDTTLMKMAECIKKSTLRELELIIDIPHAFGEPRVSWEEAREWLHRIEVGGKKFILSLEDSSLEKFMLAHNTIQDNEYFMDDSILHVPYLISEIRMSLEEAAASVNMTRKMNYLLEILFEILLYDY